MELLIAAHPLQNQPHFCLSWTEWRKPALTAHDTLP